MNRHGSGAFLSKLAFFMKEFSSMKMFNLYALLVASLVFGTGALFASAELAPASQPPRTTGILVRSEKVSNVSGGFCNSGINTGKDCFLLFRFRSPYLRPPRLLRHRYPTSPCGRNVPAWCDRRRTGVCCAAMGVGSEALQHGDGLLQFTNFSFQFSNNCVCVHGKKDIS
jgi:hypothetical protein